MKNQPFKQLLILNFAMLCLCTSGALGRFISLPPPLTIWYRVFFALLFVGTYCYWKGYSFQVDVKKQGKILVLSGLLMSLNFVAYFYALQWSNVAIGMLALFTFPIMTTLLEPIFLKTPFQKVHLLLGLMVLVGIYFLVPSFDFNNGMTQGLLIGLVAAFAWAIRNVLLKKEIAQFNSSILMFYQLAIAVIVLFPVLFLYREETALPHLPYLLFLGLVTTAIGHTLFLNSFKYFSVSTASIMASVQPIYGIIVAVIFLHEVPSGRSMIGGALILLTVIIESRRSTRSTSL